MKKYYSMFFILFLIINLTVSSKTKKIIIGKFAIGNISFPFYKVDQQELLHNCYSRIVSVGSNGSLISDLSYRWIINKEHTKYVFFIRKNIYFHDGSKLNTEEIKNSIEYSIKNYLILLNSNMKNIVGVKKFIGNKEKHIKGIIPEKDKIIFLFNKPTPDFLDTLTDTNLSIFKIKNGKFIGTGPYIPVKYAKHNKSIDKFVLKKNKKYFIKGLKSPETIELVKTGYYKDINKYDIISFDDKKLIKNEYLESFKMYKILSNRLELLFFNLDSYWGKNRNFRKFLNYSFKYKQYLKKYNIIRKKQFNIIPYGYSFFKEVIPFPRYNKEKAGFYLSKIKNKYKSVKILTTNRLNRKELADEIKDNLENHGFKVNIYLKPHRPFLNTIISLAVYHKKGNFDLAPIMVNLGSPPFTVSRFLYSLFTPGAENYIGTYDNKEIQNLISKLENTYDRNKKIRIINKILKVHNDDLPFIPLFSSIDYYLVKKNIKNFSAYVSNYIDYRDIELN